MFIETSLNSTNINAEVLVNGQNTIKNSKNNYVDFDNHLNSGQNDSSNYKIALDNIIDMADHIIKFFWIIYFFNKHFFLIILNLIIINI